MEGGASDRVQALKEAVFVDDTVGVKSESFSMVIEGHC
jgi:hypothetical protein